MKSTFPTIILTILAVFAVVTGWFTDSVVIADEGTNEIGLHVAVIGTGRIKGGGFDCASACKKYFERGREVTLIAVPGSEWTFVEWTGACAGGGKCVITMDDDKEVTALFTYP